VEEYDDMKVLYALREISPAPSREIVDKVKLQCKTKVFKILKTLEKYNLIRKIDIEELKKRYPKEYNQYLEIENHRGSIRYYFEITKHGNKLVRKA